MEAERTPVPKAYSASRRRDTTTDSEVGTLQPGARLTPLASALDACELRNILTGFGANISYLESLFREEPPQDEVLEVLLDLRESYRRMVLLCQEATLMTNASERPVVQVDVPLSRLVAEAMVAVRDAAALTGVRVVADTPPEVMVVADATLLACVLERMFHNAIRWAQPAGTANMAFKVTDSNVVCAAFATYPTESDGTSSWEPQDGRVSFHSALPPAVDSLEGTLGMDFCRVVAQSHGGTFSIRGGGRSARWVLTLPSASAQKERRESWFPDEP